MSDIDARDRDAWAEWGERAFRSIRAGLRDLDGGVCNDSAFVQLAKIVLDTAPQDAAFHAIVSDTFSPEERHDG